MNIHGTYDNRLRPSLRSAIFKDRGAALTKVVQPVTNQWHCNDFHHRVNKYLIYAFTNNLMN